MKVPLGCFLLQFVAIHTLAPSLLTRDVTSILRRCICHALAQYTIMFISNFAYGAALSQIQRGENGEDHARFIAY